MAEYSADDLRLSGLQAKVESLPGLVSFVEPGSLELLSADGSTIIGNTLGHSRSTPEGGVTAELVYVGSGGMDDYGDQEVRGRIVLCELSYAPARHEKQRIAAERGAVGAVMMNWGPPDNTAIPYGSVKSAWGNPTARELATEMPKIPCLGISRTDGLRLREACARAPLNARLRTRATDEWRTLHITTAEVSAEAATESILLGGHQDSWPGPAATDNAAGTACILELARVFNQHRHLLRRNLMIGLWTAHETGTMVGSTWFCERNWDVLRDRLVAYVQVDQAACTGTTRWGTTSTLELRRFHQAVERAHLPDRDIVWYRQKKSGDASFFGLGIPMMHGEGVFTDEELRHTAQANVGWWHHSLACTLDKVDFTWLAQHLRVYAAYLWGLCTAPILPFDLAAPADAIVARLLELAPAGRELGLDILLNRAERYRECVASFDALAQAQAGAGPGTPDEEALALINTTVRGLNRLVIPMTNTIKGAYGHDPYGITAQSSVLPALYDVPKFGVLPAGPERWMLETELLRARNRIADTLGEAEAMAAGALERLKRLTP